MPRSRDICVCGHDLQHCRNRTIDKLRRKRSQRYIICFVKCCQCGRKGFLIHWRGGNKPGKRRGKSCRPPRHGDWRDNNGHGGSSGSSVTNWVASSYTGGFSNDSRKRGHLPRRLLAFDCLKLLYPWVFHQQSYVLSSHSWPLSFLHCGLANPLPLPTTDTVLDIQVFTARMPPIDPKRTQQRYRQKSLVAFRRLDTAIRRSLDTAQRLYFLLRHGRDIQPSFLRVVLNILLFQLSSLIHHTFPAVTDNIWPNVLAFSLKRELSRNGSLDACDGVWDAAWAFGIMTGDFPRSCSFVGSDYAEEAWEAMVADGRLAVGLLMVLRWTVEDLVGELVAWVEVMERGWEEHY